MGAAYYCLNDIATVHEFVIVSRLTELKIQGKSELSDQKSFRVMKRVVNFVLLKIEATVV